jgi:hypothetical protein
MRPKRRHRCAHSRQRAGDTDPQGLGHTQKTYRRQSAKMGDALRFFPTRFRPHAYPVGNCRFAAHFSQHGVVTLVQVA